MHFGAGKRRPCDVDADQEWIVGISLAKFRDQRPVMLGQLRRPRDRRLQMPRAADPLGNTSDARHHEDLVRLIELAAALDLLFEKADIKLSRRGMEPLPTDADRKARH